MAGWKKERQPPIPVVSPGKAMVASAAIYPIRMQAWQSYRFTDAAWQAELWRLYDCIPEYHFLVNWVGGACGRVKLYAADVDDKGRVQQQTENQQVSDLVNNMLGGPEAKAECIRSLAINLTVAGEVWVIGRTNPLNNADEWLIVSSVELRRYAGGYYLGWGDQRIELQEGRDLLIRIWTPHPRMMMFPDSPSRAVYPILIEIEKLTRYVFSQLDSRLASAGVWILPESLDFPSDDAQVPDGVPAFMKQMVQVMSASLKGDGSAAALVPTMIKFKDEIFDKIKAPIQFSSELSSQAKDLRDEALKRLSWGMDTPAEALTGMSDANHWSAWHVDESTIKSVIEPLMNRICDGLNRAYFIPALVAMGLDPKKYILTFDTSALTVRPQRLQDTLNLNAAGIASDESVLLAGDYKLSDAQSDEEKDWKWARQIAMQDPLLLQNPDFCRMANLPDYFITSIKKINEDAAKAAEAVNPELANAGPPPPPPPPRNGQVPASLPPIPAKSVAPGAPTQVPKRTLMASAAPQDFLGRVCEQAALRAFEVAGGKLLTHSYRGKFSSVPKEELHTVIPVTDVEHARSLIAGSMRHLDCLEEYGVNANQVKAAVATYCINQLVSGHTHNYEGMLDYLERERLI